MDLYQEEHPFSLSRLPRGDEFRLTIRHSGDFTNRIDGVIPGSPVLVSGPFGRFTSEIAQTDKRLFIAGGVGITPIRTLAEEAADSSIDSILLYASRQEEDTPLKQELDNLAARGVHTHYIYSEAGKDHRGEKGRINGDSIARLVPDYKDRDVYLCGPLPMMEAVVRDLEGLSMPRAQIHYENFSLHN